MKKLIITCVLLIFAFVLFAEPELEQESKIKQFQTQTGDLIIKEFHAVGVVKGSFGSKLDISVLKMTRAGEGPSVKGLRITGIKPTSYGEDSSIAFLDDNEISSLIDALNYMIGVKQRVGENKSLPYTEYDFTAKDGFNIGFYISKGEYSAYSTVGRIGAVRVFLTYTDLQAVLGHIRSAKSMIDSL